MSERAAGSVSHRNPFPRDMIHCYMPSMDHPVSSCSRMLVEESEIDTTRPRSFAFARADALSGAD